MKQMAVIARRSDMNGLSDFARQISFRSFARIDAWLGIEDGSIIRPKRNGRLMRAEFPDWIAADLILGFAAL